MLGRPIGFDIRMGYTQLYDYETQGWPQYESPVALRIIYNGCNCPATIFTGDLQPLDMTTYAVSGTAST